MTISIRETGFALYLLSDGTHFRGGTHRWSLCPLSSLRQARIFLFASAHTRTRATFPRTILAAIHILFGEFVTVLAESFFLSCHGYERYGKAGAVSTKIFRIFRTSVYAVLDSYSTGAAQSFAGCGLRLILAKADSTWRPICRTTSATACSSR